MKLRPALFGALFLLSITSVIGFAIHSGQVSLLKLPTGKLIHPVGEQTNVGSFPCNMVKTPDGRFVLVTDSGFREQVSVLDGTSGKLLDHQDFNDGKAIYFGLAVKKVSDGYQVAISRGSQDKISIMDLSADGKLTPNAEWPLPPTTNSSRLPWHVAGLGWSPDGSELFAVANQSHKDNGFHGSVFCLNGSTGDVVHRSEVGAFPLDIAMAKNGQVFVANEGEDTVSVLTPDGAVVATIRTGEGPSYMALNRGQDRLYVSNSNSDTVSVIDLASRKVVKTILVRPAEIRALPSATPMGLALNDDDHRLYVALGDLNAVGVMNLPDGKLAGYISAGWYPTSVQLAADGGHLFVANAKGVEIRHPNDKPVGNWGEYGPNIIEGTVSTVDLKVGLGEALLRTEQVLLDSQTAKKGRFESVELPPIKHFVYIIKENRTYDQVLGDEMAANGDPTLTVYGRAVTPNQHALAERFGIYDNFFVCAEVSADGWNWSTSGMANEYTERNVFYNYSGRGRGYDFEGDNNGTAVKLQGRRDVAEAAGGRIWDNFIDHGQTVRNYGMLVNPGTGGDVGEQVANQPKLVGKTNPDFRQFDTAYPDSDAAVKCGLPAAPRQMMKFGKHGDPNRVAVWLRDFSECEQTGVMPNLTLLRVMRDHTAGTSRGMSSPKAMVADNDYAVGEIVDAISHSKFWDSTAIFVVEDDAQDGDDHVDSHRSNMLVVSPYLEHGKVHSGFYNTDSVLATIEALAHLKPNNDYVAVAPIFKEFKTTIVNPEPYEAILPDKEIVGQVNSAQAYRSRDSDRLFRRFTEESNADMELNEILWRDAKGPSAPLPTTPGVLWRGRGTQDDD